MVFINFLIFLLVPTFRLIQLNLFHDSNKQIDDFQNFYSNNFVIEYFNLFTKKNYSLRISHPNTKIKKINFI